MSVWTSNMSKCSRGLEEDTQFPRPALTRACEYPDVSARTKACSITVNTVEI